MTLPAAKRHTALEAERTFRFSGAKTSKSLEKSRALLARAKFVDVAAWSKPSDVKRVLDVVAPDVIVTSRELAPNVPSALAGRVLTLDDLAPAPKCTGLNTAGPPRFQLSPISTSSEVRSSCETTFCPVSSEALNHRLLRPSGVVNRGGRR